MVAGPSPSSAGDLPRATLERQKEASQRDEGARADASSPGLGKVSQKSMSGSGAQRRGQMEAGPSASRAESSGGPSSSDEEVAVVRSEGELSGSEEEQVPLRRSVAMETGRSAGGTFSRQPGKSTLPLSSMGQCGGIDEVGRRGGPDTGTGVAVGQGGSQGMSSQAGADQGAAVVRE